MRSHKSTGFTIVELLIVIVVIGVLAAITIVAYNGIQVRAETNRNISQARAFVTAFKLLQQDETLPAGPHCLGDPATYGGTSGTCNFNGSTGTVNTALNQKLADRGASASTKMSTKWNNGGLYYHGGWFGDWRILVYGVDVGQTCGLGNVLSLPWNEMTLSGAQFTDRTTTTFCYIGLEKL